MAERAPVLISLPHGLNASGVTLWAVRLVNCLAERGRACALVVHDEPSDQRRIGLNIDARVEQIDARGLPRLDACNGDLTPYLPAYRLACSILEARSSAPIVCFPTLVGDSWGVFASLTRERPGRIRIAAVHHSDTRYNDAVCGHYERVTSAFVGVSDLIADRVRASVPSRATDVFGVTCGVEVPAHCPRRGTLAGRPVRMLYVGRLDHEQKRVGALAHMSDLLNRHGVAHELAIVGDGPARDELVAQAQVRPSMRLLGPLAPGEVAGLLSSADLFVLPSRYEGLSVSQLEAMAHGAVTLVTPSASGTGQLIEGGSAALVAAAGPANSDEDAGTVLAQAMLSCRQPDRQLQALRTRAWRLVRSRFDVGLTATRYARVIDRASASPARVWPGHLPAAFTGDGSDASGTVPAAGAPRLGELLNALQGRRIAVWGTGRHTIELREVLEGAPVQIAAFLDDDPNRQGSCLWDIPILAPNEAARSGATDVVLSSWLHQDDMWGRRGALEARGLRVHRVYLAGTAA